MLPYFAPIMYTYVMSHTDDAETIEEMRQDMTEFIHGVANREVLLSFADTLTRQLGDPALPFARRRPYRELLDTILEVLRNEEPGTSKAVAK